MNWKAAHSNGKDSSLGPACSIPSPCYSVPCTRVYLFRWKQMRGLNWQWVWRQRVQRVDGRLWATRKCGFLCKIYETPHCIKLCLHRCRKQLYKFMWEKSTRKTIKYKDPIYDGEVLLSHKSWGRGVGGRAFRGSIPVWSVFEYFLGILRWRWDAGLKGPIPYSVQG